MTNFVVIKILNNQGAVVTQSKFYGPIELRPALKDFPRESTAIEESSKRNNERLDIKINSRLACLVQAEDINSALEVSNKLFQDATDCIAYDFSIAQIKLSRSGCIKNLDSDEVEPIIDFSEINTTIFANESFPFPRFTDGQIIHSYKSELGERYRRAIHWHHNALIESQSHIKILFFWFSFEALFKQDENDKMNPFILSALGYPSGKSSQLIPASKLATLSAHASYFYWKRTLSSQIEKIRTFRNDSVHKGFRQSDFSSKDLNLYKTLMSLAATRSQNQVNVALKNGISSVSEFKEYSGLLISENKNYINDIHNTVFLMLNDAMH